MKEIYKALGWQGGTKHLIIEEIERLKRSDKALNDILPYLSLPELCRWLTLILSLSHLTRAALPPDRWPFRSSCL